MKKILFKSVLFLALVFIAWDYLNKFQDRFWLQLATSRK